MPAEHEGTSVEPGRNIVGVDGCRAGWLAVMLRLGRFDDVHFSIHARFADLLAAAGANAMIAVDMPIGLPARSGIGGRACDIAARAMLGERRSALFAVPARAAVYAGDYADACRIALTTSDPPRKVSKQCFNLFAKIREVDAAMGPALQERVVECHPELAFWRLNGERPLLLPKKVKSAPYGPGLELRRALLRRAGFSANLLESVPGRRMEAGADDLLDACACAVSALAIAQGRGRRFPPEPAIDPNGLRMEIWC